jgi:hypothetical protein
MVLRDPWVETHGYHRRSLRDQVWQRPPPALEESEKGKNHEEII